MSWPESLVFPLICHLSVFEQAHIWCSFSQCPLNCIMMKYLHNSQKKFKYSTKLLMIMCCFIQPRIKAKRVIDTPLCRIFIYIVVSCPCVCLMLRQVDQSLAQLSDRKPHIILMQNLWLDQLLQAAESLKQWSNSNIFTTMIHSWHELVLLKSCLWSAPNMFTVTVVELSCLNLIFITDEWFFFFLLIICRLV